MNYSKSIVIFYLVFSYIITAVGFGLGPFVGGTLAQFSQAPLFSPYIPIIFGALLCGIGLFFLKSPSFEAQKFSFTPKLQLPEAQFKYSFLIVGWTAFCAFAAFSLFASLSPSFIRHVLAWHGPMVSGSFIASILLISVLIQFLNKARDSEKCLIHGLKLICLSLALLAACMGLNLSILFFFSVCTLGIGHGLAFIGSFGLLHRMTQPEQRAAIMSTYLFMGYLGTIIPILLVGYLSDYFGLNGSVIVFCSAIGVFCFLLNIAYQRYQYKLAQT